MRQIDVVCAICGTFSEQGEAGPAEELGNPDLDLRPPETMRSTIDLWIQRCPTCGYCSASIASSQPGMAEVVRSEVYQAQLQDSTLPAVANAFLCSAMLLDQAKQFARAGWMAVYAAWVCDDAQVAATACRKRAAELLQTARQRGQIISRQKGAAEALLIDLLRRSEQFTLALSICEDALKEQFDDVMMSVLRFQKLLIGKRDTGCYTVGQAVGNV